MPTPTITSAFHSFSQTAVHKTRLYAELVKFEHAIFALPFSLSAAVLASPAPQWPSINAIVWIIIAMVSGRTYAMALNRIIDKDIDAQNPRTQNRTIPAGRLHSQEAWLLTIASLLVMCIATAFLPPLCMQLLPLAVGVMSLYSFVKRFSWLAHFVLGFALACGAIGGWVGISGTLSLTPILWGLAVLFWVTGFDLIYACQDVDFDRQAGLFSIPARFGVAHALRTSRLCHILTVACLIGAGIALDFLTWSAWPFWLAVTLTGGLLAYEQSLVSPADLSRINEAFFLVNGLLSIGVFGLILLNHALYRH